jgi:hypothetical protein
VRHAFRDQQIETSEALEEIGGTPLREEADRAPTRRDNLGEIR